MMPLWLQHLLVLLLVAACVVFVAGQLVRTFRLKKSKLGACCAKGCDAGEAKPPAQRVVFLPSDMLNITRRPGGR
jgi:hypothetical protein